MVEAARLDLARDGFRDEAVERFSPRKAFAEVTRGDRHGRDVEELDAFGALELSEHRLEALPVVAGTGRDAQPDVLEEAVRVFPTQKRRELVSADEEDCVAEAAAGEGIDRVGVLLRNDLRAGEPGEGETSEGEPPAEVELDRPVAGIDHHEDEQPLEVEMVERGLDEGEVPVVRRIEGAAEETGHSTSTTSGLRIPAARSASRASSSDNPPATR